MADQAATHADQVRVCQLLPRLPRDPKRPLSGGASDQELSDLALRLGTEIPEDLVAWLRMCNGDTTGPGGLFGARPGTDFLVP
ncbi:SMI1/KNR4 family protein [Micromonospora cremea]|uniref:SMI1/KNR4 family protein n=1 Tax=Micromonospora cremea TaxID=709881 RepID=UPI00118108E4|nr:SMI1/KNR4 family protein [Micromonospora cremea]